MATTKNGCSECGDKVMARGLCNKHYCRLRYRGGLKAKQRPLTDVAPEQLRAMLAERVCPLCDAGPFAHVLAHVARAHGVSARAVKLRAGVNLNQSFWDDSLAANQSVRSLDQDHTKAVASLHFHRESALRASRERALTNPTVKQVAHADTFQILAGLPSDELQRLLDQLRADDAPL